VEFAPRIASRAMAWAALLALIATMAVALLASWGGGSADSNGGPTIKSPIAAKGGTTGSGRRRV
jgi:hypothetical protein